MLKRAGDEPTTREEEEQGARLTVGRIFGKCVSVRTFGSNRMIAVDKAYIASE